MFREKKETARRKVKRITQKELISHIEQLSPSEPVSYRLPEAYGGQLAVVEFNPSYPWRGSKYILSTQILVEGKPDGEKTLVLQSDEVEDIAAWLLKRRGRLLSLAE